MLDTRPNGIKWLSSGFASMPVTCTVVFCLCCLWSHILMITQETVKVPPRFLGKIKLDLDVLHEKIICCRVSSDLFFFKFPIKLSLSTSRGQLGTRAQTQAQQYWHDDLNFNSFARNITNRKQKHNTNS